MPIDLERPFPRVSAVVLGSATTAGLHARIDLTVANPNRVALVLRAVDWEFTIGGAGPVRGRTDADATIAASHSAPVQLPLFVQPGNAAGMVGRIASGDRTYRLRAVLHFEAARGDIAAPLDVTGELR